MPNEGLAEHSNQDFPSQLQAAAHGSGRGSDISRAARHLGGFFTAILGVSIALFLLAVVYVFPAHILGLSIAVAVFLSAVIISTCIWFQRARRASSIGWSRRYSTGIALTIALYGIGVALTVGTDWRTVWFWVPYALLTTTPVIVAGMMRGTTR